MALRLVIGHLKCCGTKISSPRSLQTTTCKFKRVNYESASVKYNVCPIFARFINTSQNCHRKSLYKTEEAKKIRFYVLHRFVEYMKVYHTILEKRFPGAMQIYRVFMDGVRAFYSDVKEFVKITRILSANGNTLYTLNRKELELYYRMPKEMYKVAPVLLLSTLPLANYVIFPLIYLFPRHLLSAHFWNLQQRAEFTVLQFQKRLLHNRPVFRHLQSQLPTLSVPTAKVASANASCDAHSKQVSDILAGNQMYDDSCNSVLTLAVRWEAILAALGSGLHPSVSEIVACKQLFLARPYHLIYLKHNHVKHLVQMHDLHAGFFRRSRLSDQARILHAMDQAIVREGGVHNMPTEALRNACIIRGLNPTNMKTEDMITWLQKWIDVSKHVDKNCLSLLLHCPILLGYNEPNNWTLLYSPKK